MAKIFISYRRDESTGYAGRIHERLSHIYGTHSVFMDVDDVGPGTDFVSVIEDQIASCDILLVLIGPRWLTLQDANSRRRIDDPNDFVRIEISKGLARKIRIIPLLLNHASMPSEKSLPNDLKELSRHQAMELSEERWEYDFGKLAETLDSGPGKRKPRRNILAALCGIVLVALLAALWLFKQSPIVTGRWTADVKYDFSDPQREVFVFEQTDGSIRGSASFLGVDRAIVEGKIDGDMLSFVTQTFEMAGNETRETTHRYDGKVSGQEIRFVMQILGGFSDHPVVSFTARRADGAAEGKPARGY